MSNDKSQAQQAAELVAANFPAVKIGERELIVTVDVKGDIKLRMTPEAYRAYLADKGVTAEVIEVLNTAINGAIVDSTVAADEVLEAAAAGHRKVVDAAKQAVAAGTATNAEKRLAESNPNKFDISVQMGRGMLSLDTTFTTRTEHTGGLAGDKPVVRYGTADVTLRATTPRQLTDGEGPISDFQRHCEALFG